MIKIKIKCGGILFSVVYWFSFLVFAQYYLLFPAVFSDKLGDDFHIESEKILVEKKSYNSGELKSIYYQSDSEDSSLIVFLHGNFETIDQNFMGILAASKGEFDILLLEYPGYGSSTGWPTPSNILSSHLNAINEKLKDNQKLIIWGRSLGGGNAVNLAINVKYDKLILESTFLHPMNYLGDHLFSEMLKFLFVFDLDTENKFAELKSLESPILLIHGNNDGLFNVSISHKMKNELSELNVSQIIHDGGHNERKFDKNRIYDFLLDRYQFEKNNL